MKNNELTTKTDRSERAFFQLVMLAIMGAIMLIAALSSCCDKLCPAYW